MKRLIIDKTLQYYGVVADVLYLDTENKNAGVAFSILNTDISWTANTDQYGVCRTTFSITKDKFKAGNVYILQCDCGGNTVQTQFLVSYGATLVDKYLEHLLAGFRNVYVGDELALLSSGGEYFYTTFGNWVLNTPERHYYKNRTQELKEFIDVMPDFDGRVYTNLVDANSGDELTCTYVFNYFTDMDFYSALCYGLNYFNMKEPISHYDLETLPPAFSAAVVLEAYTFLLEKFLNDLSFYNQSTLFRNVDQLKAEINGRINTAKTELERMLASKMSLMLSITRPAVITGYRFPVPYAINEWNWKYLTIGQIIPKNLYLGQT